MACYPNEQLVQSNIRICANMRQYCAVPRTYYNLGHASECTRWLDLGVEKSLSTNLELVLAPGVVQAISFLRTHDTDNNIQGRIQPPDNLDLPSLGHRYQCFSFVRIYASICYI